MQPQGACRHWDYHGPEQNGQLTQISAGRTDASGTHPAADIVTPQARYEYDDFGRKRKALDPLGKATHYVWDEHNNLIERTNARGQKLTQTWDPGARLKTRTAYWNPSTADRSHNWSYNPLGQVTREETRWNNGSLLIAYDYTYDAAHRLASIKDSRGNKTLTYHWSPGGQLNAKQDSEGQRTDYLYVSVHPPHLDVEAGIRCWICRATAATRRSGYKAKWVVSPGYRAARHRDRAR